jgi:sarcosine oxidase subunit beta
MRSTADVVIIGGGIMGASTAYHLARRGQSSVVLLEAADMFGAGSTGLNAGGVRHQFSSDVNIRLSLVSFAMMDRFADDMEQEISLRRCGYLFLLDDPAHVERFAGNVARQNAHGVPSVMVTVDEIGELAPEVSLHGIIGGSWCPRDGLVDPHGLLQGYVSQASRLGVELRTRAPVVGVERTPAGTFSVVTSNGAIEAQAVVIAAGPWSAGIGEMLGVPLPIAPIRRQIAVAAPRVNVRASFPFVIDFSQSLYFHREGDAILTGMSDPDQAAGFETTVDEAWREKHLAAAIERLPLLGDARLSAEWAGLYEVTPDDQPILGRVPEVEGLVVCAGFSGHGLMHGPAAGQLMAEEILDGRAHSIDIDPLRLERFASGKVAGEFNVV